MNKPGAEHAPEPIPEIDGSRPRIGVLALQGDFAAHARALEEAGAVAIEVRKPAELAGLDGFLESLQHFVEQKPAFGTCAGCILLAKSVSHPAQESLAVMDISVERNAYGRQIDSAIRTGETKLPGGPLEMVYIRAPRIVSVGPGVEVLAERDGFPVLVRQGRLLAATFHPELSSDDRVHRLFVDMVRAPRDNTALG
jgi:5'-phosphate synthase pdxT subunit